MKYNKRYSISYDSVKEDIFPHAYLFPFCLNYDINDT